MKKTIIYILIAALFYTFGIPAQTSALDDLSEGNRLKSVGDCAGAISHYGAARRMGMFKDDTAYHLIVADCYLNIKNYTKAVESYTAVIEASLNKTILGEMYLGRGKAYFRMSSTQSGPDMLMIKLARNDLREAKRLGLDVRDIERDISKETDKFRAEAGTGKNSGGTVSAVNTILLNRRISPDEKVGDSADGKVAEERYNAIINKLEKLETTVNNIKKSAELYVQKHDNNTSAGNSTEKDNKSNKKTKKKTTNGKSNKKGPSTSKNDQGNNSLKDMLKDKLKDVPSGNRLKL